MKYLQQTAIVLMALALGTMVVAATIYTWTDESGVIHFTDSPPPENAKVMNQLDYQPEPQRRGPSAHLSAEEQQLQEARQAAEEQARLKRRQADEALAAAEEAATQAAALRGEADAYIEKVGAKSRKQKSLRYKIRDHEGRAAEAAKQAEELRQQASLAEADAKAAEERLKSFDPPPGK